MQSLNERERAVYETIRDCVRQNGYAPSVRELAVQLGYRSTSTVQLYLDRLEAYGYITREGGKSRSIALCRALEKNEIPILARDTVLRTDALTTECAGSLPFRYCGTGETVALPLADGEALAIVLCGQPAPKGGFEAIQSPTGAVLKTETEKSEEDVSLGHAIAVIRML